MLSGVGPPFPTPTLKQPAGTAGKAVLSCPGLVPDPGCGLVSPRHPGCRHPRFPLTSSLHLLASCVVPTPSAPSLRPVTLVLRAPLLAVPSLVTSSGTQLLPQPPAPMQNRAGGLGGSSTHRDHPHPGGLAWPLALLVPLLPPPDPKASAQASQHPPSGRGGPQRPVPYDRKQARVTGLPFPSLTELLRGLDELTVQDIWQGSWHPPPLPSH